MLVKTTQYKSSGISSANLLRALEIFDLPPAISPELNKCPGSNPVVNEAGKQSNLKLNVKKTELQVLEGQRKNTTSRLMERVLSK